MLEFKVTPEQISLRIGAKNLAQIGTETFMAIRTIYKRLSSEDAEIAARTEDKSKQAIDALNAAIEALEKAMDTNAN